MGKSKSYIILLFAIYLTSCGLYLYPECSTITTTQRVNNYCVIGFDSKSKGQRGVWFYSGVNHDEINKTTDTIWNGVVLNPENIAFNKKFMIASYSKRFVIIELKGENLTYRHDAKNQKNYDALRKKLGVPDSLQLKPVKW